jgi:hypothetical protein
MLTSVPGGTSVLGLPATVNRTRLDGVAELTVATRLPDQPPAVHLDELDHGPDLHDPTLPPQEAGWNASSEFVDIQLRGEGSRSMEHVWIVSDGPWRRRTGRTSAEI